jgi:hypothetical protein
MQLNNVFQTSNPSFPIKIGSRGNDVKFIQNRLGLKADGVFGPQTKFHVQEFQKANALKADGIVGPQTWSVMKSTKFTEESLDTSVGFQLYETKLLDQDEMIKGQGTPEYLFYHHTAGWHNPYNVITSWNNDTRGRIATEFVIGGPSALGNDNQHDGKIVKCIPDGWWAYHLGNVGSSHMTKNSIGIEVCNFGYLTEKNGEFYTYTNQKVAKDQVEDLGYKWRGHQYWHKYSDAQIESLYNLTKFIEERNGINIHVGLQEWINDPRIEDPFAFNQNAYRGQIKGLLTHANVRSDKTDMFPQKNLIEMIKSL